MENVKEAKTIIGEDVAIVGSVKCTGDIEIKGKLEGDLTCGGRTVIGESAVIKGSLTVEVASILGQIDGNISAKDRIEMKSSARVNGDIKAKRLTVEDGVTFIGKSEVNPSGMQTARHAPVGKAPEADGAAGHGSADKDADDKSKAQGIFGRK